MRGGGDDARLKAYHPSDVLPTNDDALRGRYQSVLYNQRALLLMDNAASLEQVEPLISPVSCLFLVTSRQYFILPGMHPKATKRLDTVPPVDGLNPTSARSGAISAAEPVQMKANSAFSFRIAHHRLVQKPQSSSLSAIGILRDERYGWRTLSFLKS